MADKSEIGNRMKGYEIVSKTRLTKRTPVAIRIDGCHFHTFLKGWIKPFDPLVQRAMEYTTLELCNHIQGCVFGYTQSDEITLILVDYQTLESEAWFDNEVQKICSVSASMASMYFNKFLAMNVNAYISAMEKDQDYHYKYEMTVTEWDKYTKNIRKKIAGGAYFDARCFNIPKEEVTNLVYWRQLDCMRNSVLSVGQANFTQAFLNGRSCKEIKEDLRMRDCCKNWEDYSDKEKFGTMVYKNSEGRWVSSGSPIFKGEDRDWIDSRVIFD
jgi:tRNA(His) 5'-end guanylyltransferase